MKYSVVLITVHEVGREGEIAISVVFSTVHEVGREQGVLTISVAARTIMYTHFCTHKEIESLALYYKLTL
jgi:hypothetical protein